jgi:Arc/MetJ-type ribon-helix-helix transcriptional regulator
MYFACCVVFRALPRAPPKEAVMRHLGIDITDEMEADIRSYVSAGYFRTEQEMLAAALQEFLRRHRPDLEERYQMDDVSWAMKVAEERKGFPR